MESIAISDQEKIKDMLEYVCNTNISLKQERTEHIPAFNRING